MPVVNKVYSFQPTGGADFSVSGSGAIAYQSFASRSQLVWVDREGRQVGSASPASVNVKSGRLSPDGRREEQVPEILREDPHRLLLGPLVNERADLILDRRREEALVSVGFDSPEEFPMGRLGAVEGAVEMGEDRSGVDLYRDGKDAFALAS